MSKSEENDKTQMSFKDWKMQKEVQNKNEMPQKGKSEKHKKSSNKMPPSTISHFQFGGWNSGHKTPPQGWNNNGQINGVQNNFNNRFQNNCNNSFQNNFNNGFQNNNFNNGFQNNNFNNGFQNNLNNGFQNNFNNEFQNNNFNNGPQNNFNNGPQNNNFNNGPQNNNFNNRFQNNFNNGENNKNNGSKGGRGDGYSGGYNNMNMTDNFFNTDGLFVQKDMIEETIAQNPFIYNLRAKQLLRDSKKTTASQAQFDKKKPTNKSKSVRNEKDIPPNSSYSAPKTEPNIFIKNPRKETNKPYIPMPKPPDAVIKGTLEERKLEWREYREAMKPFKNREFYNAKRVVQRLSKKDPSELDEKETLRLANAQDRMASYKQKLSEKYDHYIQTPNKAEDAPGELYVLKRGSHNQWPSSANKTTSEQFKNNGNFGESHSKNAFGYGNSSGRKILGGTSKYTSFVSGGTMTSITQY